MQKKDSTNKRGYFQKSLVFITKLKNYYSFFKKLSFDLANLYFEKLNDEFLDEIFERILTEWEPPMSSPLLLLKLFDKEYTVTKYFLKQFEGQRAHRLEENGLQ